MTELETRTFEIRTEKLKKEERPLRLLMLADLHNGQWGSGQSRLLEAADAFSAHFLYQTLLKRHFEEKPEAFMAKPLNYHVKRRQPATKKQKEVLRDLIKYHKINLSAQIDGLTRNEVSRMIDKIVSQCGRAAER